MTSGRTIWQAQDAGWWRRERVVDLGEEFGPAGPAVANWLECEAKAQNAAGRVKAGYRAVARGAFLPGGADEAERIVAYAVSIGFLEDFQEGERTFTATIAAYASDQARGRDTIGKAGRRTGPDNDGSPHGTPDATGQDRTEPDVSGPVRTGPGSVGTGEERTGFKDSLRSSSAEPARLDAARERSETIRRLFDYWRERCSHEQAKLTRDRRSKIEARLRDGYTEQQIRQAIDGAAAGAFVNDAGKRFDDLELICRSGSKVEDFMGRAATVQPAGGAQARSVREEIDAAAARTEAKLRALEADA